MACEGGDEHNAGKVSDAIAGGEGGKLTVGKYPRVKTLRREVFPHAPSPIITSFL